APRRRWRYVCELTRTKEGEQSKLRVPSLLASLRGLDEGEVVLVQWVLTPIGNVINPTKVPDEDPNKQDWVIGFWGVGRLAFAAPEERTRELLHSVEAAYRGLHMFRFRSVNPKAYRKVNDRSTPITEWPGTFSADELPVVCGFPIESPKIQGLV